MYDFDPLILSLMWALKKLSCAKKKIGKQISSTKLATPNNSKIESEWY